MKLNILFLLYKSKINSKGKCPIRCRITYGKERKEFSTGLFVAPGCWKNKQQLVKPPDKENEIINTQLSLIKQKINQAFLFLQVNKEAFSVDEILIHYKGFQNKTDIGVCEMYELFLKYLYKLIDKDLNKSTYSKYVLYGQHLRGFIKWKFNRQDVRLDSIKSSFIENYVYYLKTEKNFAQITLNKIIQRFRRAIKYAISEDYLDKDPFMLYKAQRVKKEVKYLTQRELENLENKVFGINRIQQVKDMFVFCCYTGLAFKEMSNLMKEDILVEFDGNLWINVERVKTSRSYKVPLMPQALKIIEQYKSMDVKYVFPKISNPNFNAYLKEIADLVGIKINLTHHIARKTFASTVLLYNDVPMEIVSKLLGHTKLQTTQEHYASVVEKKVSEHIQELGKKLNKK